MPEANQKTITFEDEILGILHSDLTLENKIAALDEFQDYELSQTFLKMTQEDRHLFVMLFPPAFIANILAELEPGEALPFLLEMRGQDAGKILDGMQNDDLVDILQSAETRDQRVTLLSSINLEKRQAIKGLIDYDDSVVGSIMNDIYVEIAPGSTVKSAIRSLVDAVPKTEFVNNLFVVDDRKLIGVLSLKEIMSAGNQPDRRIDDLMTVNLITVHPTTPKAEAIQIMQDYDFFLLPVVDAENRMLGVVSFDDMAEAIDDESENDYAQLAAVSDIDIAEEDENVLLTVKKRFPWLAILLFCDLITSAIVARFEGVLTVLPTLALFMPLILNMAGNTGTQSLGIIIGLFAVNELNDKGKIGRHLLKELFVGLLNGLLIGILLFGMVLLFQRIGGSTWSESARYALVISLAIGAALGASTMSGALVPLFIKGLRLDPAVASGPFITTIDDILSLLIYFALAVSMLGDLL